MLRLRNDGNLIDYKILSFRQIFGHKHKDHTHKTRYYSYLGRHNWTRKEDQFILKKREEKWTFSKIAESLGLRKSQVHGRYYALLKEI